jgi:hypothetical protein
MRAGGIRFTIGRSHTDDDVRALVAAIADMVPAPRDAAHVVPKATGDFDILVRPSSENAQRVTAALTT